MTKILDLNNIEARQYFLKEESYINFDLPTYFEFGTLLQAVSTYIGSRELKTFHSTYVDKNGDTKPLFPANFEGVNYKFLNNKDGKFAWRPFQLIHPALYVSLVNKITERSNWNLIVARFNQFQANPQIRCYSIPLRSDNQQSDKATAISQWWQVIEQQSLELALKFEYVLHTDISDCYGSMYTHSIPWAIHTKQRLKIVEEIKAWSEILSIDTYRVCPMGRPMEFHKGVF